MRGAIIGCTLLVLLTSAALAHGQQRDSWLDRDSQNPKQPTYMLIAGKSSTSSSSWSALTYWPSTIGSSIASGARGTWNTVSMGTSRAWYATQYTLAPWSKPAPRSLTGSRGVSSSSKSKSKTKDTSDESTASWWPSFNWFGGEKEDKLKNVGDWQEQSSPGEGF